MDAAKEAAKEKLPAQEKCFQDFANQFRNDLRSFSDFSATNTREVRREQMISAFEKETQKVVDCLTSANCTEEEIRSSKMPLYDYKSRALDMEPTIGCDDDD